MAVGAHTTAGYYDEGEDIVYLTPGVHTFTVQVKQDATTIGRTFDRRLLIVEPFGSLRSGRAIVSWVGNNRSGTSLLMAIVIGFGLYNLAATPYSHIAAAMASGAVSTLAALIASRRTRTHTLLDPTVLLCYFQALLLPVGLASYLTLIPSTALGGLGFTVAAHCVALVAFIIVTEERSGTVEVTAYRVDPWFRLPLLILCTLTVAGAWVVSLRSFDLATFLSDPFSARAALQSASPSGMSWLLYKVGLVTAVVAVALRAKGTIGTPTLIALVAFSGLAYVTYGARLMPVLLILAVAMAYHRFVRPLRPRRLVAAGMVVAVIAITFAGYRYFSTFNLTLTGDRLGTTAARQFSGTVAELGDTVRVVPPPSEGARRALLIEFGNKTVPSALRGDTSPYDGVTFGGYVATLQQREDSGGLRVGPIGEFSLAWGLPGSAVIGALLGLAARWLSRKMRAQGAVTVVVGIVGTTQLFFVMVTGIANTASSLAVVLVAATLARACFPPSRLEAVGGMGAAADGAPPRRVVDVLVARRGGDGEAEQLQ